ncbi:hypothetical protein [Chryseobacterium indologenes]|uniref:hypothetical protein n=1 Tax=Chryseobacterium indologenes TaxID=253 RepID=UPI001BCEC289|nr:hypothetical protein [Chryseobacterium indologenes]
MEKQKVKLNIAELKKLLNILLVHLNKQNNTAFVEFEKDLYWNITDEELYDPYKDPIDLTIGSLVEDWLFLQKVAKDEREILHYDFYKLGSILKFLGSKRLIDK